MIDANGTSGTRVRGRRARSRKTEQIATSMFVLSLVMCTTQQPVRSETKEDSSEKAQAMTRYMKALRMDEKIQKMMVRIRDRQTELIGKLMTETFEKERLTPEERKKKVDIATKFLIDRAWEIVKEESDPSAETHTALLTAIDREYTANDLNEIASFYETPTGKKVLDNNQAMATSVMDATTDKLRPVIQEIMFEELKKLGVVPSTKQAAEAAGTTPETKDVPQYHR